MISDSSASSKYAAEKHAARLREWFLKLSPEQRGRVLSFEDKDGVTTLLQMYKQQQAEGDGLFFAVNDPVFDDNKKCIYKIARWLLSLNPF